MSIRIPGSRRSSGEAPRPEVAATAPTTATVPISTTPVASSAPLRPGEAVDRSKELIDAGKYAEAVDVLLESNRHERNAKVEVLLARYRHAAFEFIDWPDGPEVWPPPTPPDLFEGVTGPPEVEAADLTADKLASAMLNHGCLLVRGLIPPAGVDSFIETIEHVYRSYDAGLLVEPGTDKSDPPWYVPFSPRARFRSAILARDWVRNGGGVLTIDSPRALYELFELWDQANLREVIGGYLGERPVAAGGKCTLRRTPCDLGGADWHQDGAFLAKGIHSVNVWTPLTACGGDALVPGLDIVPRRVSSLLESGTHGAWFEWSLSPDVIAEISVDAPVIRPAFAAGDALLFDDLFVHRTGIDEAMNGDRYAIENWFFAPSTYPDDQVPMVF